MSEAPVFRFPWLALAMLLVLAIACGSDATPKSTAALRKLVFMPAFRPQANLPFVGAYIAQKKGFFAEEGLEVEIRHGTPGTNDALQALLAGQVQVSTANVSSVLRQRAETAPTVSIALIGQVGEQGLVALADSGIESPRDFEGKTVGYRVFPSPEYLAMLKLLGVDRSRIEEVNLESPDVRLLT
jgi:ABC-type nitrate/sulfonate/bicarbonate transport system substrate-binding protein